MPTLPERPDLTPKKPRYAFSIAMALFAFVFFGVLLTALSNFMLAPFFAIGGAMFGFVALHYLLWGWWLGRMIREEDEAGENED